MKCYVRSEIRDGVLGAVFQRFTGSPYPGPEEFQSADHIKSTLEDLQASEHTIQLKPQIEQYEKALGALEAN